MVYVTGMRVFLPVVLGFAFACGGSQPESKVVGPTSDEKGTDTAESQQEKPLEEHMLANYQRVSSIHSAVIQGELSKVHEHARWIMNQPPSKELDGDWLPYQEALRSDAESLSKAADLGAAAIAASAMGRACGDCHDSVGINAVKAFNPAPDANDRTVRTYMQRHRWAAERLWEGLVGPSDQAWQQGAAVLVSSSRLARELKDEIVVNPAMDVMLETIHRLGEEAAATASRAARQRLYGQFLGTCANCHKLFLEGVD
jgi:cytochrome c553